MHVAVPAGGDGGVLLPVAEDTRRPEEDISGEHLEAALVQSLKLEECPLLTDLYISECAGVTNSTFWTDIPPAGRTCVRKKP